MAYVQTSEEGANFEPIGEDVEVSVSFLKRNQGYIQSEKWKKINGYSMYL
jgi:hypothetical protein